MRIYQCLNWLTLISRDRSQLGSRGERVRCCDVMGFLISHLNRYSDWTLEELNTFDICKFQSWGNGNRNRSYLNVKTRRYLRRHKFVTAGGVGVCWPHGSAPPLCCYDWRVSSGWQQIISTSTLRWSPVVTPTLHILHPHNWGHQLCHTPHPLMASDTES